MEIQELFDYNIVFFDKDTYREIQIKNVVESSFNKVFCETTFKYISELHNDIPIYSTITLPYARITKQSLLSYYIKDGKLCKYDEKEYIVKYNRHKPKNLIRGFKGLNRGWR